MSTAHPRPGERCAGERRIGTQHRMGPRGEGQQPSPEPWALTPSGRETRLTTSNVLREAVQTALCKTGKRTAARGGRRLPGNSTVPNFSLPIGFLVSLPWSRLVHGLP